jgi:hypothetical protein
VMAEVRREVRESTRGRQVPWEHSSLEGALYFKPPAPLPRRPPRPARRRRTLTRCSGIRCAPAGIGGFPRLPGALPERHLRRTGAQPPGAAGVAGAGRRCAAPAPQRRARNSRPRRHARPAAHGRAARRGDALRGARLASEVAGRYVAENGRKALAVNPDRRSPWRTSGSGRASRWRSWCGALPDLLPHALPDRGDRRAAAGAPARRQLPRRDMPRVSGGGAFDLARIPTLTAGGAGGGRPARLRRSAGREGDRAASAWARFP